MLENMNSINITEDMRNFAGKFYSNKMHKPNFAARTADPKFAEFAKKETLETALLFQFVEQHNNQIEQLNHRYNIKKSPYSRVVRIDDITIYLRFSFQFRIGERSRICISERDLEFCVNNNIDTIGVCFIDEENNTAMFGIAAVSDIPLVGTKTFETSKFPGWLVSAVMFEPLF